MNKKPKPHFNFKSNNPKLVCMLSDTTAKETISTIRNAIFDGADGFYLDFTNLEKKHHNFNDIQNIINYTEDKPVIALNYRKQEPHNYTSDDELMDLLLLSASAGVSICDIMGDLYDVSPLEITYNKVAIDKQKKLIDKMHKSDTKVLMSSHVMKYLTADETISHAKALESRGADMVKIITSVISEDEMLNTFNTTALLKRELKVPFFHACNGQYCKLHRALAPVVGSSIVLCVQNYNPKTSKGQPLLRATRTVYNNLDWKPERDINRMTL